MEIYIVQFLYLLRPMLNAELVDWGLLGFNFFELVAILLFLALVAAFALKTLQKNKQPVSGVEAWAALLIGWITISYIVHIEISGVATYAKLVIPLMTYILLKRILPDRSAHVRMIFLMLIGFLLPFIMSAAMTYRGEGVEQVIYWTGVERYQGVYPNFHNMGHNAGLALMLIGVYVAMKKSQNAPLGWAEIAVLATVASLGAYLLYVAGVRNVWLGVIAFFAVALYFHNKRMLALFVFIAIGFIVLFWSEFSIRFYDFHNPPDVGPDHDALGSGRKSMWTWAWENWRQAPLLNQLTGMGVKIPEVNPMVRIPSPTLVDGSIRPWPDPHNDWLFVLNSLGVVGLVLFAGLFGAILRAILSMPGKEKFALLGLFVAVVLMNLLSNSYITRFQLGQMFFMLMVYADLKAAEVDDEA